MNKYLAEALGTFMLVLFGTGAIIINEEFNGVISHFGIAFAFGAVVTCVIYATGDISGAHINPAVTIGFWAAGKMNVSAVPYYIISQCIGGILASLLMLSAFPDNDLLGSTLPSGSDGQSFLFEFILTFFLMFVIMQVSTGSREKGMMAGLAVGGVVMLEALVAGPVCGASMNPARSLAPAIASGTYGSLWIYLLAPVIGSLTGVYAWKIINKS